MGTSFSQTRTTGCDFLLITIIRPKNMGMLLREKIQILFSFFFYSYSIMSSQYERGERRGRIVLSFSLPTVSELDIKIHQKAYGTAIIECNIHL